VTKEPAKPERPAGLRAPESFVSAPVSRIDGRIRVPGDKSISHRAVMLGALAQGTTEITGFLPGEDCLATLAALSAMGVDFERSDETSVQMRGRGLEGLSLPAGPLDMGNSGTAMRLFCGLLAGQRFDSVLTGDESLVRRPMSRVTDPLTEMGAKIASENGFPPLAITGGCNLQAIDYVMPVASAQVKSALLLAGLYATGSIGITEPAVTRDHTERMLAVFGRPVQRTDNRIVLPAGGELTASRIEVPGDLSSAAFFILAACLANEGELVLDHVGLNPTRTGILRIFALMQANIEVQPQTEVGGEPVGRIIVRPGRLKGADIPAEIVPLAIDEFPLVFVAAALAEGETVIRGAGELRHKESDRIQVMADGLRALGGYIKQRPDGAVIRGGKLSGGEIDSGGDHRVAMAFAVGAISAEGPVQINDTNNVATSFPGFVESARSVGMNIRAAAHSTRGDR
jgi:3-phosphoshikimate 1-carboxyvinyltransferase